MTDPEKLTGLPLSLRTRDRGCMLFPKPIFAPFLQAALQSMEGELNDEGVHKFSSNLIKVKIMTDVSWKRQSNVYCAILLLRKFFFLLFQVVTVLTTTSCNITESFDKACEELQLSTKFSSDHLSHFREEWLRKICNARFNEFWSARCERVGVNARGGESLRDKLYTLTAKEPTKQAHSQSEDQESRTTGSSTKIADSDCTTRGGRLVKRARRLDFIYE